MDELARPATMEDLKALVRSLDEQGVDYLLIGGYLRRLQGAQRVYLYARKLLTRCNWMPDQARHDEFLRFSIDNNRLLN